MQTVGQLIRRRREALRLTLTAVARRSGTTVSYLSMIENHRVDNPPSRAVLERLEDALQLERRELQHAAAWQRAPGSVLEAVEKLTDQAQRGRELARWLSSETPRRGGMRKLDQLYRSGQLRRRINAALGEPDSAVKPTATPSMPGRVPLINKVAAGYPTDFTDLGYPARAADEYVPAYGIDDPDAFAATVVGASMEPSYREGDVVVFSPLADVSDGCDCFVRLEPDHESTFKRVFIDEREQTIRLQPLNPQFPPRVVGRSNVAGMYRAVLRVSRL